MCTRLEVSEIETYNILLMHGSLTTDRLGEILNREKSTAYRSLQNLITCGVAYIEKRSLESGGYYHEYVAIEPWEMKQMIKKSVDEWYCQMNGLIEKKWMKVSTLIPRRGDEETRIHE